MPPLCEFEAGKVAPKGNTLHPHFVEGRTSVTLDRAAVYGGVGGAPPPPGSEGGPTPPAALGLISNPGPAHQQPFSSHPPPPKVFTRHPGPGMSAGERVHNANFVNFASRCMRDLVPSFRAKFRRGVWGCSVLFFCCAPQSTASAWKGVVTFWKASLQAFWLNECFGTVESQKCPSSLSTTRRQGFQAMRLFWEIF